MNRTQFLTLAGAALLGFCTAFAQEPPKSSASTTDKKCYEMRIYYAAPGKLEGLLARFREHTTTLFEKHGMTNLGYFVPIDNKEQKLVYFLSYPDREARETAWKGFLADADWKKAVSESEKDGKLVAKIEQSFWHAVDFSPEIKSAIGKEKRLFELRTYTASARNLPNLHQRFRQHTVSLFAKHGMTNLAYWELDKDQPAKDEKLVYLLAHKSAEAQKASFDAFRKDPTWQAAREASEKAAGGSLTVKDGVKSELLEPVDFSRMK
jgi:hypothetical protein